MNGPAGAPADLPRTLVLGRSATGELGTVPHAAGRALAAWSSEARFAESEGATDELVLVDWPTALRHVVQASLVALIVDAGTTRERVLGRAEIDALLATEPTPPPGRFTPAQILRRTIPRPSGIHRRRS